MSQEGVRGPQEGIDGLGKVLDGLEKVLDGLEKVLDGFLKARAFQGHPIGIEGDKGGEGRGTPQV